MKLATNLRTRAAALFAMLFLCFGMIGGFTGMANQEGAWSQPFIVAAHAGNGQQGQGGTTGTVDDLFSDNFNPSQDLGQNQDLDTVEGKVREVAQTVTTILTIISFACLLFWIARLAMSAGNLMTRKTALTGIMFSGVALALFGGAWVVVSFFWNFLN